MFLIGNFLKFLAPAQKFPKTEKTIKEKYFETIFSINRIEFPELFY